MRADSLEGVKALWGKEIEEESERDSWEETGVIGSGNAGSETPDKVLVRPRSELQVQTPKGGRLGEPHRVPQREGYEASGR